jgi:hypothetical protein
MGVSMRGIFVLGIGLAIAYWLDQRYFGAMYSRAAASMLQQIAVGLSRPARPGRPIPAVSATATDPRTARSLPRIWRLVLIFAKVCPAREPIRPPSASSAREPRSARMAI